MTKIQDLRQLAHTIKTETKVGANTADRVGSAFEGVADALDGTEQIAEMDKAVQEVQQQVESSKAQIQSLVNALPVVQETGDSTTSVMSQKAITHCLNLMKLGMAGLDKRIDGINPVIGNVTNNPDEEDLTSVSGKLKFADKLYNPLKHNGYGRVFLRKTTGGNANINVLDLQIVQGQVYNNMNLNVGDTYVPVAIRSDYYSGAVFNVKAGEKYYINVCQKITDFKPYTILDENGKVIENSTLTTKDGEMVHFLLDITQDGKLIVNANTYGTHFYSIKKIITLSETFGGNLLKQEWVEKENTIYDIQYDYDLNGGVLVLPQNSIIKFSGGKISNGLIVGQNTTIDATEYTLFENITFEGSWNTREWFPEWFGAVGDGITDDTKAIEDCFSVVRRIDDDYYPSSTRHITAVLRRCYLVTHQITIWDGLSIDGRFTGVVKARFNSDNLKSWIFTSDAYYNKNKQPVAYNKGVGWKEFDGGQVSTSGNAFMKDISIYGELTDNLPIYGAVRLIATYMNTSNVRIDGCGIGLMRSCCLETSDRDDFISGYYYCFAAFCVNGHLLSNCYCSNTYQKTVVYDSSYQFYSIDHAIPKDAADEKIVTKEDGSSYLRCPKIGVYLVSYVGGLTMSNVVTDYCYCAVYAGPDTKCVSIMPWYESCVECYIAMYNSTMTLISPRSASEPTYDFAAYGAWLTTINCQIFGQGVTKGKNTHVIKSSNSQLYQFGITEGNGSENIPLLAKSDIDKYGVFGYTPNFATIVADDDATYSNNKYKYYCTFLESMEQNRRDEIEKYLVPKVLSPTMSAYHGFKPNANVCYYGTYVKSCGLNFSNTSALAQNTLGINSVTTFIKLMITLGSAESFYTAYDTELNIQDCEIECARSGIAIAKTGHMILSITNCNIYKSTDSDEQYATLRAVAENGKISVSVNKETKMSPNIRLCYNSNVKSRHNVEFENAPKYGSMEHILPYVYHLPIGYQYYDNTTNRSMVWDGTRFVGIDGVPFAAKKGTSAERPKVPALPIGYEYYDTDLSKTIHIATAGTWYFATIAFNCVVKNKVLYANDGTTRIMAGKFIINIDDVPYTFTVSSEDIAWAAKDPNPNLMLASMVVKQYFEQGHYAVRAGTTVKLAKDTLEPISTFTFTDGVNGSNLTHLTHTNLSNSGGSQNIWNDEANEIV